MKAKLRNYRQSPRKVRLVATQIKGKSVPDAKAELEYSSKKVSKDMKKLLESAEANAVENAGANKDAIKVKQVIVDAGIVMKRYRPGARGRAYPYKKRTSTIKLELESATLKAKPTKSKSTTKAEPKKTNNS